MRLRRSKPHKKGYGRRRAGAGFRYVDQAGRPIHDRETVRRLRSLVIPPAWEDVWISPDPRGHIQAIGTDAAGRRQYLYHPEWRVRRDTAKFDHVLAVSRRLPRLRRQVTRDLRGRGLTRARVLAAVVRLLDMGEFRIGGDAYASGEEPSYGITTLLPSHLRARSGCVVLEFTAKGGITQESTVDDPDVCAVLRDLRRRRRRADRLFAYWAGRRWHDVKADEVNAYLREVTGTDMTAKDFRTWHATLLAAVVLADTGVAPTAAKRKRVVAGVMREVADLLGNTPTVARASYVDPRVLHRYEDGVLADATPAAKRETQERAVRKLLSDS